MAPKVPGTVHLPPEYELHGPAFLRGMHTDLDQTVGEFEFAAHRGFVTTYRFSPGCVLPQLQTNCMFVTHNARVIAVQTVADGGPLINLLRNVYVLGLEHGSAEAQENAEPPSPYPFTPIECPQRYIGSMLAISAMPVVICGGCGLYVKANEEHFVASNANHDKLLGTYSEADLGAAIRKHLNMGTS